MVDVTSGIPPKYPLIRKPTININMLDSLLVLLIMEQARRMIIMSSSLLMETASPFAVDSAGGLSDTARKFINDLYAKPRSDEQSFWTCVKDRINLKVRFVDSLSCILARHRAMDIIGMRTKFILRKMDIELYKYLVNLRILMIKVWGERIIFLIWFPLPPLWNFNSTYLVVINE